MSGHSYANYQSYNFEAMAKMMYLEAFLAMVTKLQLLNFA